MALNLLWLAIQYEEHDEHWFVFNLELACATGLFYVSYFLLSFSTNGLAAVRPFFECQLIFTFFELHSAALLSSIPLLNTNTSI